MLNGAIDINIMACDLILRIEPSSKYGHFKSFCAILFVFTLKENQENHDSNGYQIIQYKCND